VVGVLAKQTFRNVCRLGIVRTVKVMCLKDMILRIEDVASITNHLGFPRGRNSIAGSA